MIAAIKVLPLIIGMVIGGAGVAGLMKYTRQEIKIPPCPQPPACNCPPTANVIDIDKLKNFKGQFRIEQHYHVEMDGDSLFMERLKKEFNNLKIVRCK
jgi:hypothetical protein